MQTGNYRTSSDGTIIITGAATLFSFGFTGLLFLGLFEVKPGH